MSVTVSGKNYTLINSCESLTGWSGLVDALVTDFFKEGSNCIGIELWQSGNGDHTLTGSWDLSGTKHLRLWWMTTVLNELNTDANGGFQIGVSDGTNTGFYKVSGSDSYPGGWYNPVIDLSRAVDSGTKPVMTVVTSIILRWNLTSNAKKVQSCWIDHLSICDGLVAYGDDAGGYFDFDDVYAADAATTLGIGILRKIGGQYFAVGSIEVGDSSGTNGCKFQAKSQVLIFENRKVNSNLYNMNIVDNGIGVTEFILGSKAGTAGIEGCVIRVEDTAQTPKFDILGNNTNVDNFKLYGSTFLDADSVEFPVAATNVEILNCNFESCGEVLPNTAVVKNCNIISANDRGLKISTASHNVMDCSFINCPHCVHVNLSVTVTFSNLTFTGSDGVSKYDIEHSVSGTLTINATNGSNPNSSYVHETGGGSTTINNAVDITVTVLDQDNDPIQNAQVAVFKSSDGTQLMNEDTLATGIATESFNYSADTDIYVRVRKSSSGTTRYETFSTTGKITSAGFSLTVTLKEDDIVSA